MQKFVAKLLSKGKGFTPVQVAEDFVKEIPHVIAYRGDAAYYSPGQDSISLPNREQFNNAEGFYAAYLHELVHWTGHKTRLNRFNESWSERNRAFEELVAELGSAFLCADLGLPYESEHPQYINQWLTILKDDKKSIFMASGLAKKAVDYLHSIRSAKEKIAA